MFLLMCQSGMDLLMGSLMDSLIGHIIENIMESLMEHIMDKLIHLMGLGINPLISLLTMAS